MIPRTSKRQRLRAIVAALVTGVAAVCLVVGASAEPLQGAAAASALLEAATTASLEPMAQPADSLGGYDWSLVVAFLLGIIGLISIRRHIARL